MSLLFHENGSVHTHSDPQTYFFEDDGVIPNNTLPLLIYQDAFRQHGEEGASWLEKYFESNNWRNSWRSGVYPFQHYHSNVHEVLGCYQGTALLHMGGDRGEKIAVKAGDILIIPAGVGHKCLEHSADFRVVGAYPNGDNPDLMRGEADERPAADERIAGVHIPHKDPLTGEESGLKTLWTI
ncbi:cupin [Sphingobacterium deserti]|uniref:Cupin n=2 Tax=Sphingobacterium deserti TaxID=1229276 RepID=A0A0B8SZK9_9SPHI|nr:cupin [Sphingobacterium deserti]